MTAACGGGTSGPSVGTQAIVDVSTGVMGQILSKYGGIWALPGIALVSLAPLTASVFCATDPPAAPTFTTAEASALTQLTIGPDLSSGLTKLATLLTHWAWYELCTCTSGAVVAPGAIPGPPAGTPTSTPSLPTNTGPCASSTTSVVPFTSGQSLFVAFPGLIGGNLTGCNVAFTITVPTPPGPLLTATITHESWQTGTNVVIQTTTFVLNQSSQTHFFSLAPGTDQVRVKITASAAAGTTSIMSVVDVYCNNALPGGTASPCCPPDPATQSQLSAILAMVELLQRQLAPFAYLAGTSHVGLTGNSQFAVQGILGLSVNATVLPTNVGIEAGDPNAYFGIGWVAVGTADGFQQSVPIRHVPQLIQPVSPDVTVIGYSLNPGVTATITELVREP